MTIKTERVILDIAVKQHGVVTRDQLVGAGISTDVVDRRLKHGSLKRLHRGVYVVEPLRPTRMPEMAAVLACGESAVISHWSAARLWVIAQPEHSAPVDVTVTRGDRRRMTGIRVYRFKHMAATEITRLDGIPLTTVARTLVDLASVAEQRALEQALARADREGLTGLEEIRALMREHTARPGVAKLRMLIDGADQPAFTRSEAEERFLKLLRKADLPAPAVNVKVGRYEVDYLWRTERLVVEIDGFAHHGSRWSFESDRRRDAELAASGLRVMRVTWRQIAVEPDRLLVRLAQALIRVDKAS